MPAERRSSRPPIARAQGVAADPGAAVSTHLPAGCAALAELTFAEPDGSAVPPEVRSLDVDGSAVTLRRRGRYFWISGRDTGSGRTLVEQTRAIMRAIDRSLADAGLGFADVCKATTHYAGGSTEAELHDNMSVRNGYYAAPGPSSTGLPVIGFPLSRSLIAIDLLGVRQP
jgi:enamine deaminase RidA (YjgF/YER057c/UK114 family)